MKLYRKFICFILIYLISNNKSVLVQSSESSPANPNPGTGTQEGTSVTTPTAASTDTGSKTGVDLSLKKSSSTNEFDYKKVDKVVTYTAKSGFGFSSVKTKTGGYCGNSCGGSEVGIWDAKDPSEYATKVVLVGKGDKNNKEVTIHKLDDNKVLCVREGKNQPWQSFDLSKTNKVSINIGFKSDSFKYTNKLEGETRTFEAKDKFIFNHVRCYINKNWIDIWQTDNEKEYSNKVVIEGDAKVTIHLKNGGTKVYNKGSDGTWTEDTDGSTHKSTTDGSGGGTTQTNQTSGGTTGTGGSGGTDQSGGGTTGTDGSGGGGTQQSTPANQTSGGGTTGTDGSGGTDQSSGGTTGTAGSGA